MLRDNSRVLVATQRRLSDDELAQLRKVSQDLRIVTSPTADDLARVEVWAGPLGDVALRDVPHLRWNHLWTAGADADLPTEMRHSTRVELTTSAGNGGIPLAEHAVLLMLMLDRDVPRWVQAQRERVWDRYQHGELAGQTVGVVGMGTAGLDLSRKCQAFHMKVLGLRNRGERSVASVDQMFGPEEILEFAAGCDYLVVAAPLTESTRGLIGRRVFEVMKPTASLINISRGEIVDESALREALRSGQIAAAGLDAHAVEPIPADSAWWSEPNVIITPHNAATTASTARRGFEIFLKNVTSYLNGRPLHNVVDKRSGYAPR